MLEKRCDPIAADGPAGGAFPIEKPAAESLALPKAILGVLAGCLLAFATATATAGSVRSPGLDLSAMDRSIRPGADFFRYANGRWYDESTFAADETYIGARPRIIRLRKERIRALVEAAARDHASSETARLVGLFYRSALGDRGIGRVALSALRPDLDRVRKIATYDELFATFAEAPWLGVHSPIAGSIFYDFHEPGWMRYTLEPSGLGLPSRELYLDDSDTARATRAAYLAYVADILSIAGEPQPTAQAQRIVELETRLAGIHWPTADAQNFLKTGNSLTLTELQALTPTFAWSDFLERARVGTVDKVIVRQPSAMAPLIAEIRATPLATWRAWWVFHLISDNASYLSTRIAERQFDFYGRRLRGQQEPAPTWQMAIDLVEHYFGQAVGRLYVERWFPERNKQIVAEMFANIRDVMRERIEHTTWMSDSTRAEALKKIDTLVVKIGYPDKWPDYSAVKFDARDFYGNLRIARARQWNDRIALIHAPLDRTLWLTTPQSSGAAANPNLNEITVPVGTLEPPYFDPKADAAVNYGAIGGVLAHEFSHMFDQLGRQMDASGKLRDWWTPSDAERYNSVARRVAEQYSSFEALPGLRLDGELTLNENIADIAGLGLAYRAYRKSLGGREPAPIDGFTGDQRFFLGWAQMRAGKMREETLRQQVASGPHSPDMFRVNGVVRNIDAWYRAFGVSADDALYLPADRRASFW